MEPADEEAEAVAAGIICSLRGADLAGWTPPWRSPAPAPELIWPPVARGKRSRRRSTSAGSEGKGRWGRPSPASPLDYSVGSGSGSGASTSGGEDAGFCSAAARRRRGVHTTKVGSIERPPLTFPTPLPRSTGQRPRKKLRLPEVQQLVRSLAVENESLREEMRALQRACKALSKENDKLETSLGQSISQDETSSKELRGKQHIDQQLVTLSTGNSFVLPDLNLPPQDTVDVSSVN